jgi:hypothetical protein
MTTRTTREKDACDLLDADHKKVKALLNEAEVEHAGAKDLVALREQLEARKEELMAVA